MSRRATQPLPRGVWISVVTGMSAGGIAWLASAWLPHLTTSYARLDQLMALMLGALTGAMILGIRERRQRRSVAYGVGGGMLLGGVGALAGASILAFGQSPVSARLFAAERLVSWALMSVGATVMLAAFNPLRRFAWFRERVSISAIGGLGAGALFMLPGASDAWQAAACLWAGGAIALAVAAPELWHARAVVAAMPLRGEHWNPLATHEWPLHDGTVLALGAAHLHCRDGSVTLYPPAGGVLAQGHPVREATPVRFSGILTIGRSRYRCQVLRTT